MTMRQAVTGLARELEAFLSKFEWHQVTRHKGVRDLSKPPYEGTSI